MNAAIFSGLIAFAVLSGPCAAPAPPTPPSPPPPAPTTLTPAINYSELVEGGCYKASDAGIAVVTQESQMTPPPAWFGCLQEGGTIAGCGTPCTLLASPAHE